MGGSSRPDPSCHSDPTARASREETGVKLQQQADSSVLLEDGMKAKHRLAGSRAPGLLPLLPSAAAFSRAGSPAEVSSGPFVRCCH